MKVISDGWIYKFQKWGGVNTYFDRLMHYTSDECDWTVTLDEPVEGLSFNKSDPQILYPIRSGLNRKLDFHLNRRFWKKLEKDTNVLHPTYYGWASCTDTGKLKKPLIHTLHDCIHERFPDHQEQDPFTVPAKKEAIEKADILICVSQNTADDIDFFYPGHSDKIRIVLSGSDFCKPDQQRAPSLDYFSFVGTRHDYKNFRVVVEAVKICVSEGHKPLVKVAGSSPSDQELAMLESKGISSCFEWTGWMKEEDLPSFYYNSIALLFPSLYEGFGLPSLDVMAAGSTVIAHDGSSLPEVVGEGGLLVDCTRPDQVAEAMLQLSEQKLRNTVLISSQKQAQQLVWKQTATNTKSIYSSLI